MKITKETINKILVYTLENEMLRVKVAPPLGGRILSIYNKKIGREFLWNNQELPIAPNFIGDGYDTNFWGGIDELFPNDIPETINEIDYPDHGELWTTPLNSEQTGSTVGMYGTLLLSRVYYEKRISLKEEEPVVRLKYIVRNLSNANRDFLWKLHAAVQIQKGDQLITFAKKAQAVTPDSSRLGKEEFGWPWFGKENISIIPSKNNTLDFLYLYDNPKGEMTIQNEHERYVFKYIYDPKIFPYQWYFGSYGGFLNHYTAILELATNMPMSVNKAMEKGQSGHLKPKEEINTEVEIYAGNL